MLATRRLAVLGRGVRGVSSASEVSVSASSSGVKIGSTDEGLATAAISLVIRAGSRYEPKPGMAHALKNFVYKSTNKRSGLRLVRETEMLGGVLSAALSRENLYLTAEFISGDEGFFAEALGDVLSESRFLDHEYKELVVPQIAAEYEQAIRIPDVFAFDVAHNLAFRHGLGNSLFATPHVEIDALSAQSFAHQAFSAPQNIAVVASGVQEAVIKSLVDEFFKPSNSQAAAVQPTPSKYFGGEVRVPLTAHGGAELGHFLVAFEGGATSKPEYTVLRHLLGGESALKWSRGSSPLSSIIPASSSSSVKAFNLPYSDAGLFGFYVTAPTHQVKDIAGKAVAELKKVAKGVDEEALKRAIAQAKFAAASALETHTGKLEIIGSQLTSGNSVVSLSQTLATLDKVTASAVSKAATAALKSKPTSVAIGDTHALPYADELL